MACVQIWIVLIAKPRLQIAQLRTGSNAAPRGMT